jgi:hypothetical protein
MKRNQPVVDNIDYEVSGDIYRRLIFFITQIVNQNRSEENNGSLFNMSRMREFLRDIELGVNSNHEVIINNNSSNSDIIALPTSNNTNIN